MGTLVLVYKIYGIVVHTQNPHTHTHWQGGTHRVHTLTQTDARAPLATDNRHTLNHTHTHTPGERRTEIRIRMRTQATGNALGLSGSDGTLSTAPALSRPTVQSFNRSIAQPLCKKATDSTTRNRNTN